MKLQRLGEGVVCGGDIVYDPMGIVSSLTFTLSEIITGF